MRDLFSVGREPIERDDRLETLINHVQDIQNQISELSQKQDKDKVMILEKHKELEDKILNQEIEPIETIEDVEEIAATLESKSEEYIMIKEPEEPIIRVVESRYRDPLEQEIVKSIAKNKKTIIKQKILAIAAKQRTTSKHVKELIVDKYRYCSKATFYRYLSELKRHQKLETITINNKEYVCNITIDKRNNLF